MQKLMNLICVGNKKSIGLVAFLSTFFGPAVCQAGPEVLSVPTTGYNHIPAAINEFTVNGAGGSNLGSHQGDGSQARCGVIPKRWNLNLKVIVKWEKDPNSRAVTKRDKYGWLNESNYLRHASSYTRHKATVNVSRYDEKMCLLQVHFLPCDEVAVSTTCYGPNHPKYPDRAYFETRKSTICPAS